MVTLPDRRRLRLALAGLLVVLVLPTAVSGLAQLGGEPRGNPATAENVTFVSAQGAFGPTGDGRVVAVDTDTREIVWEFSAGGPTDDVLYYDVDPLSDREILVVEQVTGDSAYVLRIDWRADEVIERFPVPLDTHDVDYLGNDTYVVADKFDHRAFVYDRANDSITWEYEFAEHWPAYPEAGEAPSTRRSGAGGYTHLNDVDPVDGGSAFLLSPRNFDRVILVDRETKETEFVLGEEDDHEFLHEQHNPDLLSMDPPTVLVADSENDRVVEYRRDPAVTSSDEDAGTAWTRTWEYSGDLHWPRDADRLPNGNTLITDTYGQRVIEVTPGGEVVWETEVTTMPYDAERLGLPPGSAGPPMNASVGANVSADASDGPGLSAPQALYRQALWIVPAWLGIVEFYGLLAALVLAVGWLGGEVAVRVRRRVRS